MLEQTLLDAAQGGIGVAVGFLIGKVDMKLDKVLEILRSSGNKG